MLEENQQNTKWRSLSSLNFEKAHKKTIYDISSSGNFLISLSLDRLVIFLLTFGILYYIFILIFLIFDKINIWNMKTFKQEQSLTTLNGYVYSLASSPIDPSRYLV